MSLGKEHLKEFNGAFPEETEELNSLCCNKLQEYRYNCASLLAMLKTDLLAKKTKLISIGLQMYVILLILHFFSFCTIRKQIKSEIKRFLDNKQVWFFLFFYFLKVVLYI